MKGELRQIKLSFKILKVIVDLWKKIVSGEWSESTLQAYSDTKGINLEGSDRIIEHGNNIMAYKYHIENDENDSALSNLMKQDHIDNPGKYKP